MLLRYVVRIFLVVIMVLGSGVAHSQSYPNKPIRFVTTSPGGGNDFVGRIVAHELTARLGQQVIIDYRGGGGGVPAADLVAKAKPDGYTFLSLSTTWWTAPFLRKKVPYDPLKDFMPISTMAMSPSTLVVNPSLPVKSVKELIAYAKANPGKINYATSGAGASAHICAEMFKSMAGLDMVRVVYKGNGPGMIGVITGEAHMMFPTAGTVTPFIKSGKVRPLAMTALKPSPLAPGLPPVAVDLPGFEQISMYSVFAPANTPLAIINKMNEELRQVINSEVVKQRFLKYGIEAVSSSPEELAAFMKADMARVEKVIKAAGITAQ